VEFSKSVRRTLDKAVENGQVDAVVAQTISTQIEEAAYTDQRPHLKDHITVLQAEASQEVFAEARSQLLRQYAQAANPSPKKPDGPSMH
jgi:ABC-type amino acid transport substrate-binding protein